MTEPRFEVGDMIVTTIAPNMPYCIVLSIYHSSFDDGTPVPRYRLWAEDEEEIYSQSARYVDKWYNKVA